MKRYAPLAALVLATSLAAQSPLTTLFAGPNGSGPGAVTFFNLTVSVPAITVNRLDVNSNAAAGTEGRIRVWQTITGVSQFSGSEQNYANWQLLGEGSVIAAGLDLPTTCCFATPFTLTSAMGTRGYAVEHIGIGARYTNGNGTNQNYSNAQISLAAGVAASNGSFADQVILGGNVSLPFAVALLGGGAARVFNGSIHYAIGTSAPVCSYSNKVGLACGGGFASWFNLNATPAQASPVLQGKSFVMTPNANGAYDVSTVPALPVIPFAGHTALTGFVVSIAGQVATDDGEVTTPTFSTPFNFPTGTASSFNVHTNGLISTGSNAAVFTTLGADWAPTTTALFATPFFTNPTWCSWHDFDLTTAGAIRYNDSGTQIVITFDAVPNSGGVVTNTSTIQWVFDLVSGQVSVTFQTVDAVGVGPGANAYSGNPYLVGYTPGGAQVRPTYQVDTALFSTQFGNSGNLAHFALTSTPRPVFGSIINYNVANLNAGFPLGFLYFSVANPSAPGFPLSFLGLGKPGCLLNFDLPNAVGPFNFSGPGLALALDTNTITPSVLGLTMWSQALVFDLLAPSLFDSLATSNALNQSIQAN